MARIPEHRAGNLFAEVGAEMRSKQPEGAALDMPRWLPEYEA